MYSEHLDNSNKIRPRAVIYCRVSSGEQVKGYSLDTQEMFCTEYIRAKGYELAGVFREEGESAKTTKRTQLKKMWDFSTVKSNNVQIIVAYKLDRIARNRDDYRELVAFRKKHKLHFAYVTEAFEDNPSGRFMEDVLASVSHFDNDVRTERSMNGMKEAIREDGRYVWKAPYGYDNKSINGQKSNLVPNRFAPLVVMAFEMVERRAYSTDEVRRKMAEHGMLNSKGQPMTRSYFYRMLRNKIYTGRIEKLGITATGSYEPIVSPQLFESVQAILSGRKNKVKKYQIENPDFPLRRFVFDSLGMQLTGYWAKGQSKKYPYYAFKIDRKTFPKITLESEFKAFLDSYALPQHYFVNFRRITRDVFKRKNIQTKTDQERIEKEIKSIHEEIRQHAKNEYEGIIDRDLLRSFVTELRVRLRELECNLAALKDDSVEIEALLEFVEMFTKKPSKVWADANLKQKILYQWFVFPSGIQYENSTFRTNETCSVFKLKSLLEDFSSSLVTLRDGGTNTSKQHFFQSTENDPLKSGTFLVELYREFAVYRESMV